jgi:hypothetical protein
VRPFALATTAVIATIISLVFGAGVGLAADYQDGKGNVCEGTFSSGSCVWGAHVTGFDNVALGDWMMPALTSGNNNVAVERGALQFDTTGEANVAIGVNALQSNKTGSKNLAIGFLALGSNTEGSNNLASGDVALRSNTTGHDNLASGTEAMRSNTTGIFNLASGSEALFSNTTGSDNVASGFNALFSNTTGNHNIASDFHALFSNTTGSFNIATGSGALASNTTAINNLASGFNALNANTTGNDNVASGVEALVRNTTGSSNIASGVFALPANTTGEHNLASGAESLNQNTTGSFNIAFGQRAGQNLTTGSNNIDIANAGVAAEAGTTRIGTEGTQTRTFVAGVYKRPIATPACAVKVNAEGQLGCNPAENSTAIATFASRKAVASGNCLAYTDIGPAGTGACPAKTTGFSTSALLAGPTPANGATVTNLYVDSNAAVSGADTVLVAVIDNTTGATLLSCTVDSTTKNSCSNAGSSGSAAAGENIEVKLTATGASATGKLWRVTFRF